jgi:hypothetical protein
MLRDRSKPHASRRSSAGLKAADVAQLRIAGGNRRRDEIAPRIVAARESRRGNVLTAVVGAASVCARSCGTSWVARNIREWCATYRVADHRLSQEQAGAAR